MVSTVKTASRTVAGTVLAAVGGLHLLWAAGSSWPAASRKQLARAVAGSTRVPPAGPTLVVAAAATTAGALVGGLFGDGRPVRWARRGIGAVLLVRGLTGGGFATQVLGMRPPGRAFRRLDAAVYRPLCLVLGVAAVLSA